MLQSDFQRLPSLGGITNPLSSENASDKFAYESRAAPQIICRTFGIQGADRLRLPNQVPEARHPVLEHLYCSAFRLPASDLPYPRSLPVDCNGIYPATTRYPKHSLRLRHRVGSEIGGNQLVGLPKDRSLGTLRQVQEASRTDYEQYSFGTGYFN
jgi:hypothetical protein